MKKNFYLILLFGICILRTAVGSQDTILIIDFGSPITHCIETCVQQIKVNTKTCWYTEAERIMKELAPKGIILSGSPDSVMDQNSPRAPESVFSCGLPVLGICYGQQLMCVQLGGCVARSAYFERGETTLYITSTCALTENIWPACSNPITIWMGHEDHIVFLPEGFTTIGHTLGSSHAIIADDTRKFYGLQFHPEVQHLKEGQRILHAFVLDIVGAQQDPSIIPPKFDLAMIIDSLLFGCCNRN